MLLSCPDCQLDCQANDESHNSVNCPSCGMVLRDGPSELKSPSSFGSTENVVASEQTGHWNVSLSELLPKTDQLPRMLGRYELLSLIGKGGFAKVFLAKDRQLDRLVALKLPRVDRLESMDLLRNFLEEAQSAAKLEHPGLVRIYDIGWITEEVCFIAMEYFPGGSLDRLLANGPIEPARVVEIVATVAEAVHFAHQKGIVHRDIKPSNIMLDQAGHPRLVDFGLAANQEQLRRQSKEVSGTMAYMSPEQLQGDTLRLDGRADVWSLGVLLYRMLTGQRPFDGVPDQLREEILFREPRPLRQFRDEISPTLEQVCLRCLAKEPTARYGTARDLADALRASIKREEPSLVAPTVVAPLGTTILSWSVSVVAVVLAAIALWLVVSQPEQPSQAMATTEKGSSLVVIPAKFTADLRHGFPFQLLDRKPEPLFWFPDPEAHWSHENRELKVSSRSISLFALGEIDVPDCDYEVEFSRAGNDGLAGVFFGAQTDPDNPNVMRLHTIRWQRGDARLEPNTYRLSRQQVEYLWPTGAMLTELESRGLGSVTVPYDPGEPHRLMLQFRGGHLRHISWCGDVVDKLTTMTGEFDRDVTGKIGLYNEGGATRFRDVRLTLRKGLNNG